MKKFARYAAIAAAVLLLLGGALLLAANLYVQSQAVQHQIRAGLAGALKMPAEIKKTTLTPWEGLRIDGITMQPAAPAAPADGAAVALPSADSLKADSFRVRFAFWPLFGRRLVIKQVLLDRPQLTWAQNADGRWQFPPEEDRPRRPKHTAPPSPETVPEPPNSAPPTDASPAPDAATPPAASPAAAPAAKEEPSLSVAVDRVKLRHGLLEFLDRQAQLVGRFEEVNLDARLTPPRAIEGEARLTSPLMVNGELWFGKAGLPRVGLELTDFQSGFAYDEEAGLTLKSARAKFAGGTIRLDFHVGTAEANSPYTLRGRMEDVALGDLLAQSGGDPELLRGRLQGSIDVQGNSSSPANRTGTAKLSVIDGRLKDLPALQLFGAALGIEDITRPTLKQAELTCRLEGEVLYIEPLIIAAQNVQVTMRGRCQFGDNKLDLQARLIIDQDVSRNLPAFIEGNFTPCGAEAPGSRYVDFTVTGTLDNPKTNLRERVLAGPHASLLQNLLAPKPKKPKKPKPNNNNNSHPPSDAADGSGQ